MERADPPSSGGAITGIAVLALVYIPAAMASGLPPVLPLIAAEFAQEPGAAFLTKMLLTIYGIAALFGSPLTGPLLRRWGFRRLFLIVALGFVGAGIAGMFATSLPILLATRFVAGFCAAVCSSALAAFIITRLGPGKRERWLGYVTALGAVWSVLATILVGYLGGMGWRPALLIHLLGLPLFALVMFAFRGVDQIAEPDEGGAQPVPASGALRFAPEALVGVMFGAVVMSGGMYLPFRFSEAGFGDPARIATLMAWLAFVCGVASLSYGFLRRWLSVSMVSLVAFTATGAAYLALALWPDETFVMAHLTLLGLGLGLLTPNLPAFAGRRPLLADKATAVGISKGGFYLGAFVFQSVTSLLGIDTPGGALMALAVIAFPSAFVLLWPSRTDRTVAPLRT